MELKKNPKSDLESKRGIFLPIGLIVSPLISGAPLSIKQTSMPSLARAKAKDEPATPAPIMTTSESIFMNS